ncbi:hypothetical protein HT136_08785 [Novosphingobium profundi]|uniref:hypothetical protein n=1 Tax=Novosphingobium profundi TaxID=1774954 RepID=UPI001BDB4EF1|nr:hypothetical protein [Novosphingobium profundi]MBT0668465.1 hypothetical protein [Novosphingobium profundi]
MDLNQAYAAHQCALIDAGRTCDARERSEILAAASRIAQRISAFQHSLGARAAQAWHSAPSPVPFGYLQPEPSA